MMHEGIRLSFSQVLVIGLFASSTLPGWQFSIPINHLASPQTPFALNQIRLENKERNIASREIGGVEEWFRI